MDFFFVRKQKLDFYSAYEIKGHDNYRYTKGFNIVGMVCLFVGIAISLLIYNPVTGEVHSEFFFHFTPTGCSLLGTGLLYYLLCKPPYLVLGTHHSFTDFYVTPLALFPHRANFVSELEGFENYGEWIYRQVGCLGTRKFIDDMGLIKNIKRVVDRGGILVLYPEARYANVGGRNLRKAFGAVVL